MNDKVDAFLQNLGETTEPAPATLEQQILRNAVQAEAPRPLAWLMDTFWKPALAAALPLCVGLTFGLNPDWLQDDPYADEQYSLIYDFEDQFSLEEDDEF